MVQFAKLRLAGFKSFVDPTELDVLPGLTGIVGPNGCGKSNLLEALRWCMGESSARQMRGDGMDDVIFNGTTERPSRNIAEVTLTLENRERKAPAAFNEFTHIEVCRKIERDSGSSYRVNGREVRAHDVKLLFADVSSGPRSTAIVGQGRVSALIQAKPPERRLLLEEAAGITGLHSRRHEAELKLRAAEQNLVRLDDVILALQNQLQNLKRQARQASRYRNLSDHIRRAEALACHLRWRQAESALSDAQARLAEIEALIRELTVEAARATTALAATGAALPQLRQAESSAAAEWRRDRSELEQIDAEEQRVVKQRAETEGRLQQIAADRARETALVADAAAALERLDAEKAQLDRQEAEDGNALRSAETQVSQSAALTAKLEDAVTALTRAIAAAETRRADLARRIAEGESRIAELAFHESAIVAERSQLEAMAEAADGASREHAFNEAAAAFDRAQAEAERAEQARGVADTAAVEARHAATVAQEALAGLRAEESGLRAATRTTDPAFPPLTDRLSVTSGYEAALGAALGDDLAASLDPAAPIHWGETKTGRAVPALPEGVEPLARFVSAPPALAQRLAQIGVAESESSALPLVGRLAQGQRIVTKDGRLWRWDGYTRRTDAPAPSTARLMQLNRLRELETERSAAEAAANETRARAVAAEAAADVAFETLRSLRDAARRALSTLNFAREEQAREQRRHAERNLRLAALAGSADRVAAEQSAVTGQCDQARSELDAMPATPAEQDALTARQAELRTRRAGLAVHMQIANRLAAEAGARRRRLDALAVEQRSWSARRSDGESQMAALDQRRSVAEADLAALTARPAELAQRRDALAASAERAEKARKTAADRLAVAETQQAEQERARKSVESRLADAREARGRGEGAVAQSEHERAEITQRIAERLNVAPAGALAFAEIKEGQDIPSQADAERRLERLVHERETMGPVNLRAEQEADELEQQIATYHSERTDLTGAIERFRRAIAELNREGRARLLGSFEAVNTHFAQLFARLFGGGHAHLELIEAEDPLESGLEVMASPPGKKLQSLSLLSGGEQALTALSLLFAVFLTNPAPVCILDEVDAPLDDANVDRFCTLVEDIATETATRFLIVTHHRMTMARMHRLYGVTMGELGVSRLVSVDLEQAERMREAA